MPSDRTVMESLHTQRPMVRRVHAGDTEWTVARVMSGYQARSLGMKLTRVEDGLYFSSPKGRKWLAWSAMGDTETPFHQVPVEKLVSALGSASEGWPGDPGYKRKALLKEIPALELQLHPAERAMRIFAFVLEQPRDKPVYQVFSPALGIADADLPEFYVRFGDLLALVQDLVDFAVDAEAQGVPTSPTLVDSLQRIRTALRNTGPNETWSGAFANLPADPTMTLGFTRSLIPIQARTPPEYSTRLNMAVTELEELERVLELDDAIDPVAKNELLRFTRRAITDLQRARVRGGVDLEAVATAADGAVERAAHSGKFSEAIMGMVRRIPTILRPLADAARIVEAFGLLAPGAAPLTLPSLPDQLQIAPPPAQQALPPGSPVLTLTSDVEGQPPIS